MGRRFAEIILPLAVKGLFTYSIPDHLEEIVRKGVRVVVPVGRQKLYSGIVAEVTENEPEGFTPKDINSVFDPLVLVNDYQLQHWKWIAEYYMCSHGEVLKAAVPSAFLSAGTQDSILEEKYKPHTETFIKLAQNFSVDELHQVLNSLERAPLQHSLISEYIYLTGYNGTNDPVPVKKAILLKNTGATQSVIIALIKKKIIESQNIKTGRLLSFGNNKEPLKGLSVKQSEVLKEIISEFSNQDVVLLHGVTSSGKTEIYIHLIEEQLKAGKQVLYLLPEIALTTQIIERLRRHFGDLTGIYHSGFSDAERVEIWNRVASGGYRLILGVRSSLFLPFSDLGLVIVDEEHDTSYKQHDPAPRYNARDAAIILASLHHCKTLLGSASPSVESYHNAIKGKYGLVELKERFGKVNLPGIIIANTREAYKRKLMVSHFSPELLHAMDEALGKGEQIILFRNRRGFSSYIECTECGWIPSCTQCSVNLTYHKENNRLVCHYCGVSTEMYKKCGSCHSTGLSTKGFGTEKVEDEIRIVFPEAKVSRLDQDTTRNRNAFYRIIKTFEEGKTDILIGTQMISKGLDFENLTVVGILNADAMLNFPDFRAYERSFQMMEQVSGRAGRRSKQGKVIIQTSDPSNKIIRMVLKHDYRQMFDLQLDERRSFNYPPFCRLISVALKHRDKGALNIYADSLAADLRSFFGSRVLGPEFPIINRIQSYYIKNIILKIEKSKSLTAAKNQILESVEKLGKEKGASMLRIAIDVDPY